MLHNLKIEWLKIKNYRVFQVFSALYLVGILGIIFIFYKVYQSFVDQLTNGMAKAGSDMFALFSSDSIWNTVCFSTSFLLYLPGMIIILLFTNEVNFKTHRQNIIDGWKRETFILSKISLIACISLVTVLMNVVAVFMMCQMTKTAFSFNVEVFGYCFLQSFTYLLFALTLATLFRKSGIAIILFFIYGLILEGILIWAVNKGLSPAGYFLPLQVADSLIPFPKGQGALYPNLPEKAVMLLGTLGMCGIYIFFAVRKYTKDDL